MKKVLITGVAGFIGSNLLDFLIENTDWEIVGIDDLSTGNILNISQHLENKRFKFIKASIFELNSLREYSTIFHLAALPRIQPSYEFITEHIKANLLGSIHLIELMIKENYYPRLVNSSSSAIYGNPIKIPTDEEEPKKSLSPYAFQKEETERYLEILSEKYPIDYVNLRYFNPYGPRSFNPENKFNAYSSVVGIFLYRYKNKLPLQITGDGKQKRDFINVKDVARINYLAAIYPEKLNTSFNVGTGESISILELAKMISDNYEFIPKRPGEADITCADISKAKKILGWEPIYNLKDYIKNELK